MSQFSQTEDTSSSVPPPASIALLQGTADFIGLDAENKQLFVQSGRLYSDDIAFEIHIKDLPDASLRVVTSATMTKPEGVKPTAWHDALLLANASAMVVADWGFALDEGDVACLLMTLPSAMHEPELLRAALESMHDLCTAVRAGVRNTVDVKGRLQ